MWIYWAIGLGTYVSIIPFRSRQWQTSTNIRFPLVIYLHDAADSQLKQTAALHIQHLPKLGQRLNNREVMENSGACLVTVQSLSKASSIPWYLESQSAYNTWGFSITCFLLGHFPWGSHRRISELKTLHFRTKNISWQKTT